MRNNPAGDAETLLEFAREKGLKGAREDEATAILPLDPSALLALAQKLESEGRLRILSFTPLFLVSRESVDFLGRKILLHITQFHKKNPKAGGVPLDKLKKRFDAPEKALLLALKTLVHGGALKQEGDIFSLAGFQRQFPPREEQLLDRLEEMYFQGGFRAVSLKDIEESIHLTQQKLRSLQAVLVERKKIVPGQEDVFFHSRRLDELVGKIRGLSKKKMSVADFKELTGLSRKFAIPLLELLDEMGVTRRDGSIREIL